MSPRSLAFSSESKLLLIANTQLSFLVVPATKYVVLRRQGQRMLTSCREHYDPLIHHGTYQSRLINVVRHSILSKS